MKIKMIKMINVKTIIITTLLVTFMTMAEARLSGDTTADTVDEMHLALQATRTLKAAFGAGNNKGAKTNKNGFLEPSIPPSQMPSTSKEATDLTTTPTWIPSAHPTVDPTRSPTSPPMAAPTVPPTSSPSSPPMDFDSIISVVCKPDGVTILTPEETKPKTIICNSAKPSCRKAVTAVRESMALQNFFGCAGNLGEGAARKLFHKYATSDILAEQLTLVATTNTVLVTEQPDAMKAACMSIGMALSPPAANPCCQGSAGCTSITASASNSNYPPFMTVAVTACVGDSACKDMGPNPLILDASCTGVSACESMNQNEINPFITGVTFVGEGACTNTQSCEGVGHRSHGDVTIQTGACISPKACYSAGRRVKQSAPSFRYRSHIDIGPNACVGSNACKDAHSTVSSFPGGKREGSLTIGDGGCADEGSCEKLGLNDRMKTDIIVPPGGCGGDQSCWACMTKSGCDHDAVYVISDAEGACPKGGRDTNFLPTGDKVEKYCVGKDMLPTECPTFFPTPLPTVSSNPTPIPTTMPTDRPSSSPSRSQAPSTMPSTMPTTTPGLEVGCLEGPGNVASTFNTISDQVFCNESDGACADFVDAVEGLPGNGDRMIKSIFGCNDDDTPGIVAIGEAQARFDKIKNDRDITELLVKTVAKGTRLFTGSEDPLREACGTDCCTDSGYCDTFPPGVMTVSENSCMEGALCGRMVPDTIIIESCVGDEACGSLGGFNSIPHPDVKIGYWVIGPKACHGSFSCCSLGLNIFGNVRIKSGACDGDDACYFLGRRNSQGDTTSPIVADITIGENACHGEYACQRAHARTSFMGIKIEGSLLIEQGACDGESACEDVAHNETIANDIVIKERACGGASSCQECLRQYDCGGGDTMTYTISGAGDCPGPDPGACSLSN